MPISITFLGAAGTVTGSKYLVDSGKTKILVDCGVFQGSREWRERNWHTPEIKLEEIDAVLLTHAHIDHTGLIPRYHNLGLKCPIYCTAATHELAKILLTDSGYLHEQEARYRAERGTSRHSPPLPLYTRSDAERSLKLFKSVSFNQEVDILPNVKATWARMGHILGAASIVLKIDDAMITFSGDIGRYDVPILVNPQPTTFGDLLLIESTYGGRLHGEVNPKDTLEDVISETSARGGVTVIPSFAVGRAQLILYYLRELKEKGRIPDIPVIVDSPMAKDATEIYRKHPEDYDEAAVQILSGGRQPFNMSKLALVRETEASISLNKIDDPMVIISASGMLSGGRILHHLKHRISDPRNSILFVGYQPPGGRGAWIQSGAETLRLFGKEVPIKAEVNTISGLSAHADFQEMIRWCGECSGTPNNVAIVHGEPESASDFKSKLESQFGWNPFIPRYLDTFSL